MANLILTRTHILRDSIKGYLTIEGSNFSCYTLEAKCPYGQNPINRVFAYALDCGTYPIELKPYKYFPFLPFFKCKPYKNIGIIEQTDKIPRSGCVAVGTSFATEHFLVGFDNVASALREIIYSNYRDWCYNSFLIVKDDPDLQTVCDGYEEEDDSENYNFANI